MRTRARLGIVGGIAALTLATAGLGACGGDPEAASPRAEKEKPSGSDPKEENDPTSPAGSPEPAGSDRAPEDKDAQKAAAPAGPNDADGEPLTAELAVDPVQKTADCAGPFNCFLPNPIRRDRNRAVNPATDTNLWPIAPNTEIFDGIGGKRGTVTSTAIKINYGQRKTLLGAPHVYAFSVGTSNGVASSWVPESAVKDSLAGMPTVLSRDPGKGDYEQVFTITGGDPAKYGDMKVVANTTSDNAAGSDYMLRPGNVVNVLYALPGGGGVSNDTYPANAGVKFKRARGVASVYVYLYTKATDEVVGTQRFVYGHVEGRYGWIARDAMAPASETPGPSMTFCCAKCKGRTALHRVPGASDCTTSATAYCDEGTRGGYESSTIGSCGP
jgi:hypothetical protein